jgi:N-acetylmuramoyl-L-alanine amidase
MVIQGTGHGGVINNTYQTAGKRSPIFKNGEQLLEGEFVREIVHEVEKIISILGIANRTIPNTDKDMPLKMRTDLENILHYENNGNTILIDVHCNAHGNGAQFTSANGTEVFYYSPGGQILAERLQELAVNNLSLRDRGAKYANFHMLRESHSTAILWEIGFMTNEKECSYMLSTKGRQKIINTLVQFIQTL